MIKSFRNSGANPFVSEGFNSRVICWHIAGLVYEAVSISCLVVLYVSIAPLAELQLWAIRIGRPKARNLQAVTSLSWIVLRLMKMVRQLMVLNFPCLRRWWLAAQKFWRSSYWWYGRGSGTKYYLFCHRKGRPWGHFRSIWRMSKI